MSTRAKTVEEFDTLISKLEPGELFTLNGVSMRFVNIYRNRTTAQRVAAKRNVHPFQLKPGKFLVMHPSTEETP